MSSSHVNPKVKDLTIGIREFRDVSFYPLSIKSEGEVADLLKALLLKSGDLTDHEFGVEIISAIQKNLGKILGHATGEDGDQLLDEMDNDQFIKAIDIIYSQNFSADTIKNGKSLFEKMKPLFQAGSPSKRPPHTSAKSTDTPFTTSSKNTSKMEE